MGVETLGFSDHSYTYFDESYCMMEKDYPEYLKRINSLKQKYEGKMKILCGIEVDMCSAIDVSPFDYTIGSAHYLDCGEEIVAIDESKEALICQCNRFFGGDMISLAERYFNDFSSFIVKLKPDIVGHFDYIAKDNLGNVLFNDQDPRYVKAWKKAADEILAVCKLFEINVGCVSRGYKPYPYPKNEIMEYIHEHGGKFILTSDAHAKENICYKFDEFGGKYEKFL